MPIDKVAKEDLDEKYRQILVKSKETKKAPPSDPVALLKLNVFEPLCSTQEQLECLTNYQTTRHNLDVVARDIAKSLFAQYPVPKILHQVWDGLNTSKTIVTSYALLEKQSKNFQPLYLLVGSGGSLFKHYKEKLTRQEAHKFLACKHDLSIAEAFVFAVCVTEKVQNTEGKALRLAKTKLNRKPLPLSDFWKSVAKWLMHEHPVSIQQANDLLDYLEHRHAEEPKWQIFGNKYTLSSLLKKMQDWHWALRRMNNMGEAHWEGHAVDNYSNLDEEDSGWEIVQIRNTRDLATEGTEQRHCVASYKNSCLMGYCSIWSMRQVQKGVRRRKLTIELHNAGSVVQVRGLANRRATRGEMEIVGDWAKQNGLYLLNHL